MALAAASRREFVMCAPFAKERVVAEVLSAVREGVGIRLFTRWRPDEVAAGVSDTAVLSVVRSRGGSVHLFDRLHAKYYRNEENTLVGSANLTATALGWNRNPNLELLVAPLRGDAFAKIEQVLMEGCTVATDALAQEVDKIAALLPVTVPEVEVVEGIPSPQLWIPSLRMPSDLYQAYRLGASSLASRSGVAAAADLNYLDLPPGLEKDQFDQLVGHRIRTQPLFIQIDEYIKAPRRFGEMRRWLSEVAELDRSRAEDSWQTLMRWMFEFMPERYRRTTARHTEIISLAT